jgi:hypothetical protein
VASNKINKHPRNLAYLYPKMSLMSFHDRVNEYYQLLALKSAEDTARALNALLLPSACLHHRRRDPARRVMINGRNYYIIPQDEVTELEWAKYRTLCAPDGLESESHAR